MSALATALYLKEGLVKEREGWWVRRERRHTHTTDSTDTPIFSPMLLSRPSVCLSSHDPAGELFTTATSSKSLSRCSPTPSSSSSSGRSAHRSVWFSSARRFALQSESMYLREQNRLG
jgi:hypothetical protein